MSEYLCAQNISKIYNRDKVNEAIALHDVSLSIENGEFVCIMGPIGSGKSTLLNVLTTLDRPTLGKVFIQNQNIKTMSGQKLFEFRGEQLGFVFQNYHLIDELTIEDNILLPMAVKKTQPEKAKQEFNNIIEKVKIAHIVDKYPHECSGGECQRAAIARALIHHPSLLALDEPTGNLDSANSHEILNMISYLNKELHNSILMVTHDAMIASYANRVIFLTDGTTDRIIERKEQTQYDFFIDIAGYYSKESITILQSR